MALQVLVTVIKNLIIVNKTAFEGFISLVIASLLGIATALNPDETIRVTGVEASWLCMCINSDVMLLIFSISSLYYFTATLMFIGHPFGSFLSGFLSDALGRRRAIMLVMVPAVAIFMSLYLVESFWLVCLAFFLLSFIFGLKDAPASVYVSEIRWGNLFLSSFSFKQNQQFQTFTFALQWGASTRRSIIAHTDRWKFRMCHYLFIWILLIVATTFIGHFRFTCCHHHSGLFCNEIHLIAPTLREI